MAVYLKISIHHVRAGIGEWEISWSTCCMLSLVISSPTSVQNSKHPWTLLLTPLYRISNAIFITTMCANLQSSQTRVGYIAILVSDPSIPCFTLFPRISPYAGIKQSCKSNKSFVANVGMWNSTNMQGKSNRDKMVHQKGNGPKSESVQKKVAFYSPMLKSNAFS